MPLHINAIEIPTGLEQDETDSVDEHALELSKPRRMMFPLHYQQTIFRAEEPEHLWLQLNVTGLSRGERPEPIKMSQKVVQILLHKECDENFEYDKHLGGNYILSIEDVQVVEAKDELQPPRMMCGKLTMMQTTSDPSEWDEYGKIGTWSRTWNLLVVKLHGG